MPSFNDFLLQPATRAVLAQMEITEPTPIQAEAIPALLAGKDIVGQSATGSGKTLAYSIPVIERLAKNKREAQALIMVPTRELAVQVNTVISRLAARRQMTTALLVGGKPYERQISALKYGAQIIVGTPGRIKDHLDRGTLVLSHLRICVLDEADQMLDIGFAPAIEEILTTTPETRQTALFSATMPEWITKLQEKFLKNPVKIEITREIAGESTIEQIAYQVPQEKKMAALCTLLHSAEGESSIIFGRTKYGVEKLGEQLTKLGYLVGTLHGDKSQSAREKVLSSFRQGQVRTLLATNVAARGLDIKGISQVINYELPESSELFTHRIGRTGRMGQTGKAITLLAPSEVRKWRRMERTLGQTITVERLTINEEALVARPVVQPVVVTPERSMPARVRPVETQGYSRRVKPEAFVAKERVRQEEPVFEAVWEDEYYEQRNSAPTRKVNSVPQERGRKSSVKREAGFKARPSDVVASKKPGRNAARIPENFTLPELPYSGKQKEVRRGPSKPGGYRQNGAKRRTESEAMVTLESGVQRSPRGRRGNAETSARPRRAVVAKRSGRR